MILRQTGILFETNTADNFFKYYYYPPAQTQLVWSLCTLLFLVYFLFQLLFKHWLLRTEYLVERSLPHFSRLCSEDVPRFQLLWFLYAAILVVDLSFPRCFPHFILLFVELPIGLIWSCLVSLSTDTQACLWLQMHCTRQCCDSIQYGLVCSIF